MLHLKLFQKRVLNIKKGARTMGNERRIHKNSLISAITLQ